MVFDTSWCRMLQLAVMSHGTPSPMDVLMVWDPSALLMAMEPYPRLAVVTCRRCCGEPEVHPVLNKSCRSSN